MRARFAAQHISDRFRVLLRRPAAQVSRCAASYAQVERVDRPRADFTVLHLADEVGPGRGQLVDAPGAVHDEGTRRAEPAEHLRDHRRQLGGVDADDLRACCGGIRERPEHVEHRPHAELAAHRSGVAEAGMVGGREDEAEAELVDRPGDAVRLQLEVEAERLEHVGGTGGRRDGAVAVLCDARAGGGRHERRRRGDVERPCAIATCSSRVHEVGARRRDGYDVRAHGLRAAGDLIRRLALGAQRDEEAGRLGLRRFAGHDLVHRGLRRGRVEIPAVEQLGDRLLNHREPSRKFCSRSRPSGSVSTDSGWNCTPSTGSVRWRTPITSPSSACADTSSSSGMRDAASEW